MKKLMNKKILHKLNTCTIVIEKEYYFLTANFSQKLNIRFSLKSSLETKAIFRITKLIQKFWNFFCSFWDFVFSFVIIITMVIIFFLQIITDSNLFSVLCVCSVVMWPIYVLNAGMNQLLKKIWNLW